MRIGASRVIVAGRITGRYRSRPTVEFGVYGRGLLWVTYRHAGRLAGTVEVPQKADEIAAVR